MGGREEETDEIDSEINFPLGNIQDLGWVSSLTKLAIHHVLLVQMVEERRPQLCSLRRSSPCRVISRDGLFGGNQWSLAFGGSGVRVVQCTVVVVGVLAFVVGWWWCGQFSLEGSYCSAISSQLSWVVGLVYLLILMHQYDGCR